MFDLMTLNMFHVLRYAVVQSFCFTKSKLS